MRLIFKWAPFVLVLVLDNASTQAYFEQFGQVDRVEIKRDKDGKVGGCIYVLNPF